MKLGTASNWSIQRILWICFIPLVVILAIMAVVFYLQIQEVDQNVTQVVDIQNPLELTAIEMQITAGDIKEAVTEYLIDRDTSSIDKVEEAETEFEEVTEEFGKLASNNEEAQFGEEIVILYDSFQGSPSEIIKAVDRQYGALDLFREEVEDISDFISDTIGAVIGAATPDSTKKLEAALDMLNSVDIASSAVELYVLSQDVTQQQAVLDAQASFEQSVAQYGQTTMSDYEERWLTLMDTSFDKTVSTGSEVITLTDGLQNLVNQFETSIEGTRSYLENTVQPALSTSRTAAVDSARGSSTMANISLGIMVAIGLLIAGISVLAISRMITRPMRGLVEGAEIVDSGKLDFRFNVDAKGELGQLAFALNRMLTTLQRTKDVLGESEETAWQILDSTTDSVILTDRRGFILASNEIAAERYGQSLEQMIDTNFYDLLPEDLRASRKAQIADVVRTGKPVHFEDEREGMILDHRIYPVLGVRGEVSRIAIFARDVTVHKWVEEVSEQLRRRNELILEAAGEGIYGLDTEGRTTFVNPAAARMLGYKPEDLIGQKHHELVHHSKPDGRVYPEAQCPIYAAFKDGTVHASVANEVFWRKDGTSFPVEYSSTPIFDKGTIAGAVVTFRDITERKRMEEILLRNEERYRHVFESAANLIVSIDKEGVIVDCNSRSQDILGYKPDELVGKNLVELIRGDDREKALASSKEVLSKGYDYHKRYRMMHKDGSSIDVQINAAAVKTRRVSIFGQFA